MSSGGLCRTCCWFLLALVAALEGACASSVIAYPGPRRPAQDVARLHARDFEIEEVDGYRSGWTSQDFELAPGTHMVLLRLSARRDRGGFWSEDSRRVCFVAEAGHSYAIVLRVLAAGARWVALGHRIADETSNGWVPSPALPPTETSCEHHMAQSSFRIGWPFGTGDIRGTAMAKRQEYFEQLKKRVAARWSPLEEYARRNPSAPDLVTGTWGTGLHIQVKADGSLVGVQIAVPSGSALLDQIAVSAVQAAQPFPAPSPDAFERTGMLTIPMGFEVLAVKPSPKGP
jgi:TonB family protein